MSKKEDLKLVPVKSEPRRKDIMANGIFYVTVRKNYNKDREDYFPYIAPTYTAIAKNFKKGKAYPVLSVKPIILIADDEKNVETSQFLVPTENGNFIWVQSEIFKFLGVDIPEES